MEIVYGIVKYCVKTKGRAILLEDKGNVHMRFCNLARRISCSHASKKIKSSLIMPFLRREKRDETNEVRKEELSCLNNYLYVAMMLSTTT
jgi:hypothetical protein